MASITITQSKGRSPSAPASFPASEPAEYHRALPSHWAFVVPACAHPVQQPGPHPGLAWDMAQAQGLDPDPLPPPPGHSVLPPRPTVPTAQCLLAPPSTHLLSLCPLCSLHLHLGWKWQHWRAHSLCPSEPSCSFHTQDQAGAGAGVGCLAAGGLPGS